MLRHAATLPEMMNYNKIFSIAWIWGPFVLSLAYTGLAGMETPPLKIVQHYTRYTLTLTTPTGTLTSLLTKPWQPDFFRSVDQLVRQSDIEWIIEDGSALVDIGKDAEPGSTLKSV